MKKQLDNDYRKIALVLCLDRNKENKYEYEFINCVRQWRGVRHNLSNIDIIVYMENGISVNQKTLEFINNTSGIYVRRYDNPHKKYLMLNTIYCQHLFERDEKQYDYSIQMDLDMYLKKGIPTEYLFLDKNIFCIYSRSSSDDVFNYRLHNNNISGIKTFNTFFKICKSKNNLHGKILDLIDSPQYTEFFEKNILVQNNCFYYEEGLFDYAYHIGVLNDDNCIFFFFFYIANDSMSIFNHRHIKSMLDYAKISQT